MGIQTIQRILMNAIILQMLIKHNLDEEIVTEEWLTQEYKSKCKFFYIPQKIQSNKTTMKSHIHQHKEEQYNDTAQVRC